MKEAGLSWNWYKNKFLSFDCLTFTFHCLSHCGFLMASEACTEACKCLLEHNTICLVPYLTTHAWNCSLFLFHKTLQPYKKGHLPGSALMRQIAKQLPWCSPQDKIEQFSRPDIFDNKTADWLEVTAHSKELNRI